MQIVSNGTRRSVDGSTGSPLRSSSGSARPATRTGSRQCQVPAHSESKWGHGGPRLAGRTFCDLRKYFKNNVEVGGISPPAVHLARQPHCISAGQRPAGSAKPRFEQRFAACFASCRVKSASELTEFRDDTPVDQGKCCGGGGIEPARPDLRYRCSKGVRAGQSMFPGCPVHAFTSPGSRRTASNVCHRVKTVSNKRAEGFCPFGSGDGFTRRVAARGAGRFR